MNEQPLNLRRSLQILREHWIAVCLIAMLGFGGGAGFASLKPPLYSATALVALSPATRNVATQIVVASSNPVLASAARGLGPAVSVRILARRVEVTNPLPYVLSITAQGSTAAATIRTANAVAASYAAYISAADGPGGMDTAAVLRPARSAARTWPLDPVLRTGGIGALAGGLIGAIGVLAVGRNNSRLRRRDEIADAVSVPVLASVPVHRAANAHQWTRLLDDYKPGPADGRRLRNVLSYLGIADATAASAARSSSVTVITLSGDPRALALGPQLAVFAASEGIPTALVTGGPPVTRAALALQAAFDTAASSRRSDRLHVAVAEDAADWPGAVLTVAVAVVDPRSPRRADAISTDAVVLGVSAGVATAEQLARVATSTGPGGHGLAGVIVADPDPADATTGRLPQGGRRTETPTRTPGATPLHLR